MADINRLKVVLVENLQTVTKIAFLLGVEVRDLINKNEDIYEDTEAIQ